MSQEIESYHERFAPLAPPNSLHNKEIESNVLQDLRQLFQRRVVRAMALISFSIGVGIGIGINSTLKSSGDTDEIPHIDIHFPQQNPVFQLKPED